MCGETIVVTATSYANFQRVVQSLPKKVPGLIFFLRDGSGMLTSIGGERCHASNAVQFAKIGVTISLLAKTEPILLEFGKANTGKPV